MSSTAHLTYETLLHLSATMSDRQIAGMLHVGETTVCHKRVGFGIPSRSEQQSGLKGYAHVFDRQFFRVIDSPEKAYILGFIIADGSIHRRGEVRIWIQEDDEDLLITIRACMKALSIPIVHTKVSEGGWAKKNRVKLSMYSKEIVSDLLALGLDFNKTFASVYPLIPAELDSHCIRGILDGDGNVSQKQFSIHGTNALISQIQERVKVHTTITLTSYSISDTHSTIFGAKGSKAVLQWLYTDPTIALARKYAIYKEHWL